VNLVDARVVRPPGGRRVRWLVLMLAVVLGAGEVSAHAFPDRSEPRVGSTLDQGPSQVQVWFDGEIEPVFSTIRVENDDKQRVDRGDGRVNPGNTRLLEVTVDSLPPGRYRVYWSVIARDGHRTEGDFRFRVK
jgi:copper resistance protein C